MRATYADVTACPTTDPVATSAVAADRHTRTNPRAKPERAKERAHSLAPDLVFRVDSVRAEYNIPAATLTQPHPALLFRSIEGKSAILGDLKLASIRWTVKGNLTFAFVHDEQFSIKEAKKQAWTIWDHVCPLLNFPKNCDPNMAITLDTGEPWHNIVIHSVPLPGAVVDGPPLPNIFSWLRRCGVAGEIKTVSFMCSDDDLGKRDKAPLRVSLSSQGDADMLVRSGALILGSQCRSGGTVLADEVVAEWAETGNERDRSRASTSNLRALDGGESWLVHATEADAPHPQNLLIFATPDRHLTRWRAAGAERVCDEGNHRDEVHGGTSRRQSWARWLFALEDTFPCTVISR
ncbi:hypothetical protein K438DRAFT_1933096 [Mycena galopus ATCC 62051]|nr:hypothetical protein K438DRAFT_1933096 [Mycena galopus ATCC 62051]